MFGSTNPENERIRALSILRSFTESKEAVNLFDGDQNYDRFEMVERAPRGKRTTQAVKAVAATVAPKRQTREQPVYARREADCCP